MKVKSDRLSAAQENRPRRAQRATQSSDVTRFRGLTAAIVVATGTLLLLIGGTSRGTALVSPGPLSAPHRRADVACAACHDARPEGEACGSCHGKERRPRPAHRPLAASGALSCSSCHPSHQADEGVVFSPDGGALHYEKGRERVLSHGTLFRPATQITVPVVRAGACAGCHALEDVSDPISRCGSERGPLLAETPTLCFDEHSSAPEIAPGREAAREALGEMAARGRLGEHRAVLRSAVEGPVSYLSISLVFGLLAWVLERRRRARRKSMRAPSLPLAPPRRARLPVINTATCLGCSACVDACPYDVLAVEHYVARVVRPEDCCGLVLCERSCPNGSLSVRTGDALRDLPLVDESLEAVGVPGLYLAGDLTGLPLIKNAINQGASAVRALASDLRRTRPEKHDDFYDLAIVGAGPAGLSAALEARAQELGFVVFEQASVAESIRSFPRGKLVFDQPLELPLVGKLWLAEATKEALLRRWERELARFALPIREGTRVTGLERLEGGELGFVVSARNRHGPQRIRARRVLLCLGRRGTPRKLEAPIADEGLSSVHYSLADAESFRGRQVVVVGLGDSAMEAAMALAHQPGTRVTVLHRGKTFARGKQRNTERMAELVRERRIELLFSHAVRGVRQRTLEVEGPDGRRELGFDALFVMIGSLPPWDFLEAAGVERSGP